MFCYALIITSIFYFHTSKTLLPQLQYHLQTRRLQSEVYGEKLIVSKKNIHASIQRKVAEFF